MYDKVPREVFEEMPADSIVEFRFPTTDATKITNFPLRLPEVSAGELAQRKEAYAV